MKRLECNALLSLQHTAAEKLFLRHRFPWEVLGEIKDFILSLGPTLDSALYDRVGDDIWIAKTAVLSPSAHISGPCIIGGETQIRHCAFIRGSALIGENCVIGNSTELKNVIIFDNVQVPHYNYVGDSVLGYRSHLGAGAITSNVKSDKTPVSVNLDGKKIETGLKKFGAVLGDCVEVGCSSVLNPGTVIGRNSNIYPLSSVRGYVKENSIYKRRGEIADKY